MEEINYSIIKCSLGSMLVASSSKGLCAVTLSDQPSELIEDLKKRFKNCSIINDKDAFMQHAKQFKQLVDDPSCKVKFPLDMRGTLFQKKVWKALTQIPIGKTETYGELAQRLGMPKAVRAVARACGANPIAIIVPCHRVVGTNGSVTGYRWGIDRKRKLLEAEATAK